MNKKIGPLNLDMMREIGKSQTKKVFSHCKHLAEKQEDFVRKTLLKHSKYVEAIAKELLKKETIHQKNINNILPQSLKNTLEPPVV